MLRGVVVLRQNITGLILLIAPADFAHEGREFSGMTRGRMQRTGWNKRLLASTRGKILALLRTENRTVNELAAALSLTDNAVRAHLLSLERDGLVQQHGHAAWKTQTSCSIRAQYRSGAHFPENIRSTTGPFCDCDF